MKRAIVADIWQDGQVRAASEDTLSQPPSTTTLSRFDSKPPFPVTTIPCHMDVIV